MEQREVTARQLIEKAKRDRIRPAGKITKTDAEKIALRRSVDE